MDRDLQIGLGIVLVGAALGVGGYYLYKHLSSSGGVSGTSLSVVDMGNGILEATVTWPGNAEQTVQAAIVGAFSSDKGIIDGHFFASEQLAREALSAYQAGNMSLVQSMVANPADRLVVGNGKATLYAAVENLTGAEYVVWLRAGNNTGSLIQNDATGTKPGGDYIAGGNVLKS